MPSFITAQKSLTRLQSALTFATTFDQDISATFSKGEANLYTAPSYGELEHVVANKLPEHIELSEGGKTGKALTFKTKEKPVIFYPAAKNIQYYESDWSGTVSLWLSVDPDQDLAPGYTDPIQITDAGYDDAALWVDFSDKNPRDFRMGTFGDVTIWNPEKKNPNENPQFINRLIQAIPVPFSKATWTHVVIAFEHLNAKNGRCQLYINGTPQGERSISEPFTWEVSNAKIFLGLNYIGRLDEVSIFDRALDEDEVKTLYELPGGIGALIRE